MRPWIRFAVLGLVVLVILFNVAYVFMALQSKEIIVRQLEALTHRKVSIGYYNFTLPLNLEIRNLNVEGLAKIEAVFISPSLLYLLTGRVGLNKVEITRPEITFVRNPPAASTTPEKASQEQPAAAPQAQPAAPQKIGVPGLIFKRLSIKGGKINFTDHTAGAEGIQITVRNINLRLTDLYTLPVSAISEFSLSGRIPWQKGEEEGKIEAEGWLNLSKKDMQATLKITDIDGVYLYPYYSNWVNLEKARIEKAKLNFSSNIHGLNNNLTAECHLELADIVRKPRAPDEEQDKAEKITDFVLGMLKAMDQGKIVLDFTLKTKMDMPDLGFDSIKNAVEDKLVKARKGEGITTAKVLMFPAKLLEGTVKSTTDLSKAVIDGSFAVGNELKKAIQDAFRRER